MKSFAPDRKSTSMWSLMIYFPLSTANSQVLLEDFTALCTSGTQQFFEMKQQAFQVKMAVEIEWRSRLHLQAQPGATSAGTLHEKSYCRSQLWRHWIVALLSGGSAPSMLCPRCTARCSLLLFSACSKLQQLRSPGWLSGCTPPRCAICQHLPLLFLPGWSCGPLMQSLPSGSLVWVPEQITRYVELCMLCKNSPALCFGMFGANKNGIFTLLMRSCCKHTLPLHVDKSDLFGTGFHWVFRSWNCQGETKVRSLVYSPLYPGVKDTTSQQYSFHWLLLRSC